MKKYRFCFSKPAYVVVGLIFAAAIVSIVFAALRLAGTGDYLSVYPAVDIITIVEFSILPIFMLFFLLRSHYAFEEDCFTVFKVLSKRRIPRDSLCKFVIDEATKFAVLYFFADESCETLAYVTVNLRKKDLDSFTETLRAFKSDILIEINPVDKSED